MPHLGGRQLYDALRQKGENVRFLFISGYSAAEVQQSVDLEPAVPLVQKPWALGEFLGRVRGVLDSGGL